MTEVKTIRVFISSPGDVVEERRRAALVLGRLKRDFARFFNISPELWEYEPMIAAGSFQDVIIEPASTDVVVMILWSRLGTPLPPHTALREYRGMDGHSPVTGTEWEFENALRAVREKQARHELPTPDILVYKKEVESVARGKTAAQLDEAVRQMAALEQFWARYFLNPAGQFTLAFNSFTTLDSFEQQLEAHLRALLQKRIEREEGKPATWPGNPFLGLLSFEFEHADIFFGRARAVQEITETLVRRAETGRAFILVTGASGCGKSSLVKAGVLPSLMQPGVVSRTQLWRRCILRPSGAGFLCDRLAAALTSELALPELGSLKVTANQLSAELRRGEIPSLHFGLLEAGRKSATTVNGHPPEARLVLVVDQLEELFTDSNLSGAEREWFVDLLVKLAASGDLWVIATMRSDYFAQMAAYPRLRDQCSGDGLYHLLPPRPEEIGQMIQLPAEAAGISFEVDPRSNIGLDRELQAAAASNPYSLPWLEFTLDELYRRDILARGGRMLRIATYRDELKKLGGAIAARAEAVCNALPAAVREQALPEILRGLVAVGDDDKPSARVAPLSELKTTPAREKVLDALISARLLVVRGEDHSPSVGVTHEALITEWPFYCDLVGKHVNFLRARGRIATQAELWRSQGKDPSRLLAPGLALEEGRALLARRGELGPNIQAFIDTSIEVAEKAERRKRRLLFAVAGAATLAAVVFAVLATIAHRASVRAQTNFELATTMLSTLIESVPEQVEPVAPLRAVKVLMDEASSAISQFPKIEGNTPRIRRYRAEISLALGVLGFDLGQFQPARTLAQQAETELKAVAADDPTDFRAEFYRARSLHLIGMTYYQVQDDNSASQHAYEKAIAVFEDLIRDHGQEPNAWAWQRGLADVHQDFGDLLLYRMHAQNAAKAQYDLALEERQGIAQTGKGGAAVEHDIGWTINKLGDILLNLGEKRDALAKFESARDHVLTLGAHLQDGKIYQNHLALIYNNIGNLMRRDGRYADAIGQFMQAITLMRALSGRDPENTDFLSVLGWTYDNLGQTWLFWAKSQSDERADHVNQAKDMLEKARSIRVELADMKPQWQQDLKYTDASIAATDGIVMEMENNNLAAADDYARAADLNQQVAEASRQSWDVERTIEFDEWAAAAYTNTSALDKARERLNHAVDIAESFHGVLGDSDTAAMLKQLQAMIQAVQNARAP